MDGSWPLRARLRTVSALVRTTGIAVVVAIGWYTVNLGGPVGPAVLLWIPSLVVAAGMALAFRRTARTSELPSVTRRFWRRLTVAAVLVCGGCTVQLGDAIVRPDEVGPRVGPVMLAFNGIAMVVVVVALYRLPLRQATRSERIRVLLDAGTVMLAAAVFLWHFVTRALVWSGDSRGSLAMLLLTVLVSVAVWAVTKVVISSHPYVDRSALRLLTFCMSVAGIGPQLLDALVAVPHLAGTQVMTPFGLFLAVLAGERQCRARPGVRRGVPEVRRRSYSVLPYVAVAAIDGLLLVVTLRPDGGDVRLVAGCAVLVTGLVVGRQLLAFRDNGRLLTELDFSATHDALTRLPNRALFAQRLDRALTAPGPRPVAVALIDLDEFKVVNDTLGHETGDGLLIAVAERLHGCVRAEDTVARLGGDEFVVVLDGADPVAAGQAAERMIATLQQPVLAGGHELPVRASIGVANGTTGDDASALLRYADIAMYAAKGRSGSAYLPYDAVMASGVTDPVHVGAELREAIAAGRLFLLFQPIVALDGGRLLGAEALVRWAHPERGTLAPDTFIPVAERTGLIVALDRWVLRAACRQLADWTGEHGHRAPAVLNVNVSARGLREPDFAADVEAVLAEYGVGADRLVLEVTETMVLEPGASVTALQQLRRVGVRVSLDDFGTGQSTLSLLHECPVDEIKLDRSFTRAVCAGRPTMASTVLHLAHAMDLHVVAEGVETAEQAALLSSLGYVAAQGFHFARPMPVADVDEMLRERLRAPFVPID